MLHQRVNIKSVFICSAACRWCAGDTPHCLVTCSCCSMRIDAMELVAAAELVVMLVLSHLPLHLLLPTQVRAYLRSMKGVHQFTQAWDEWVDRDAAPVSDVCGWGCWWGAPL